MDKKIGVEAGYICGGCAHLNGGVWPKNHVATMHMSNCDLCGRREFLAAWDDWNWPNRPRINRIANKTREI